MKDAPRNSISEIGPAEQRKVDKLRLRQPKLPPQHDRIEDVHLMR